MLISVVLSLLGVYLVSVALYGFQESVVAVDCLVGDILDVATGFLNCKMCF